MANTARGLNQTAAPVVPESILWERLGSQRNAPAPRCQAAAAVCRGALFLFGGKALPTSTAKSFNDLHTFDATFFTWDLIAPSNGVSPPPRNSASLLSYQDDKLILFGGCDGNVAMNDLWLYSVDSKTWKKIKTHGTERPKPVCLHTAVIHKDKMYLYGGWMTDWGKTDKLWVLDLAKYYWESIVQPKGAALPERRFDHIATVSDGFMYVFGGAKSVGPTNELWKFSFAKNRWSNITAANGPSPRKAMCSVQFDANWLILGGCQNDDIAFADAWQYNFEKNEWTQSTSFQTDIPQDAHCCVVVNKAWSDFLIMATGRVRKMETTNEIRILSMFKSSGLLQYEENCELIKQIQKRTSLSTPSLEELALILQPVVDHRKNFAGTFRQTLAEMIGHVLAKAEKPDSSDLVGDSQLRIYSIFRVLVAIEKASATATGTASVPRDANEADTASASSKLVAFLRDCGIDNESVAAIMKAVAADTLPKFPVLPAAANGVLKGINEPLRALENQIKTMWDVYLSPGVKTLENPDADKAASLIVALNDDSNAIRNELYELSYQLTDVALPIRERRNIAQKRTQIATHFLMNFVSRVDRLAAQLDEAPFGMELDEKNLQTVASDFVHLLKEKEASHAKEQSEVDDVLSQLQRMLDEAVEIRESELSQFESRRARYAEDRSKLIEELKTFAESTIAKYNSLIDTEKQELLNVEKKRREENEMRRQIAETLSQIEAPVQHSQALNHAYRHSITFGSEIVDKINDVLSKLQRYSNRSAKCVVEDILRSAQLFPALSHTVLDSLGKSLEIQEKALCKLDDQMKSKLAKMELLENAGDPAELASEDEVSESSLPQGKGIGSVPMDSLLAEALSYGVHDGTQETPHTPYQRTLLKYNQYKQLFERLQCEVENLRERMDEIRALETAFGDKLTRIRNRDMLDVKPESKLRHLLDEGFSWETAEKEVQEKTEIEEWLRTFYNVDRLTAQPAVHTSPTNSKPQHNLSAPNATGTSAMRKETRQHGDVGKGHVSAAHRDVRKQGSGPAAPSFRGGVRSTAPETPPPNAASRASPAACTPAKRRPSLGPHAGASASPAPSFMKPKQQDGAKTGKTPKAAHSFVRSPSVSKNVPSGGFNIDAASKPSRKVPAKVPFNRATK